MCAGTLEVIAVPPLGEATRRASRQRDLDLLERVQAGSEAAFRQLVEKYQTRIYRTVSGILRNPADAEEIAQEVFTKVWFAIRSFDGRSSLFTWIYRIAVNECYAWLRKKRVPLVYSGDCSAPEMRLMTDHRPGADRDLAARDLASKLLARLPEQDRTLLLLREVEGLPLAELAVMAGLPENTIKVRLFRARKKLAALAASLSRRHGGASK